MSAAGVSVDLLRELRSICGDEHVIERSVEQLQAGLFPIPPDAGVSVRPGTAEEVASILRLANAKGFVVTPAGGGTEMATLSGPIDIVLHTERLTQIEHYDHADLTVGVGAGMSVAQLNAIVRTDKLMFACDPPLPERATIGGILATAAQGPMRHGFGALRDYCIGVRFVTGDGRKAKAGGRVVKNVAGYDMMKLLIGSYGTLAVITSASFKLFPAPRQTCTFLAEFSTWQEALAFRNMVVRSPLSPMCLELVSPRARTMLRPEMSNQAWMICVRAAGSDAVLARYRKELGSSIAGELDGEKEAELWRVLESFPLSLPREGLTRDRWCYAVIGLPISQIGAVIHLLQEFATAEGWGLNMIGRAGAGVLVLAFRESASDLLAAITQRMPDDCNLRQNARGKVCVLTQTNVPGMQAVKQALDPNNVLRGRELF